MILNVYFYTSLTNSLFCYTCIASTLTDNVRASPSTFQHGSALYLSDAQQNLGFHQASLSEISHVSDVFAHSSQIEGRTVINNTHQGHGLSRSSLQSPSLTSADHIGLKADSADVYYLHTSTRSSPAESIPQANQPGLLTNKKTTDKFEKRDRFRVVVTADKRVGKKMIYIKRDLVSWGDKAKFLASPCEVCKLALNKMNTTSLVPDKDTVPLIREVIALYKSYGFPMEPIREILMDACFKNEN